MGKIILVLVGGFLAILSSHNSSAIAASAISIQYGIVEHVMTIKQESSHAGGAVVGGLLGAVISGPRGAGASRLWAQLLPVQQSRGRLPAVWYSNIR